VNYRRGYLAELKAIETLAKAGCVAARTAGSHSPFDVIAVSRAGVRLIQVRRVKTGAHGAAEKATDGLRSLPVPPGISREVWVWLDGHGWAVQKAV